jgi:hypothetical protein
LGKDSTPGSVVTSLFTIREQYCWTSAGQLRAAGHLQPPCPQRTTPVVAAEFRRRMSIEKKI